MPGSAIGTIAIDHCDAINDYLNSSYKFAPSSTCSRPAQFPWIIANDDTQQLIDDRIHNCSQFNKGHCDNGSEKAPA